MSVSINNISKSFQTQAALKEVTFDVNKGDIFGLIGPDGAGKSTLFRIVASLLKPDEGSCTVFGHDSVKDYRKIREIIGYMPGRFSLYFDLTVEENLRFYATVFGTNVSDNYDLIKGVYSQIEPYKKRLAGQLSGGMKQKLALSCALIHRPELLILDEPTTGVDAVSRMEFWEMLDSIKKEGITIIVSTPYMDEAALCDQVGLLQKGRILSLSNPEDISEISDLPVFSLRSHKGVYRYLSDVRAIPGCNSAWLFGDELHVTLEGKEEIASVTKIIDAWQDDSIIWKQVKPGIEDAFIQLMQKN